MEELSLVLIILSIFENLLISLMVYSLLSIKKFDRRFLILVVLLTTVTLSFRILPVSPLILMLLCTSVIVIYINYFYIISLVSVIIAAVFSIFIYIFFQLVSTPLLVKLYRINYTDINSIPYIRLLVFLSFYFVLGLIIFIIRHFKLNINSIIMKLKYENLKLLFDDDLELKREKRVINTIYLVMLFLLIQGLFININIFSNEFPILKINNFFTSPLFIDGFIIVLNIILLYILYHSVITLREEREEIVKRIKEKNLLRLDWEKRAQMHDRNHHLGMLYILLQLNKVEKAKEYLKGMVGEIKNVEAIVKSGNQVLNALLRSKISLAKENGIVINICVEKQLKKMNIMDWDLNRIIGNLLDNAIEAAKNAEESGKVELIIDGGKRLNTFEVITHGVLIPEDFKKHIFERGYSSKKEQGHGLGLAICKELSDAYHGNIEVKTDTPNQLTSFRVSLPVAES